MTAAAYMRFGSVGIKCAFQKYVAEATGKGSYGQVNKLISTGSAAMLIISVVGLIPVSMFSHVIARIAGVPQLLQNSTAGAISLLALIMVLANSGAAFEAIVMGAHRIDLVHKFNIVSTVLEAVAVVVLLSSTLAYSPWRRSWPFPKFHLLPIATSYRDGCCR